MGSESDSSIPDSISPDSSGRKHYLGMHLSFESSNIPDDDLELRKMSKDELVQELLRLRHEHHRFKQEVIFQKDLLRSVGQAVICTDLSGNITYWNRAAEQIYGWSEEEAVGQSIMAITPADTSVDQAAEIFTALSKGEVWSGEFLVRRRDSTSFHAMVTDTPIMDADHKLVGVIGVSADISEMKKKEQEIRALNTELEMRVMERTEELEKANKALKEEIEEHLNAKNHLQKCIESLEESRDKISEQSKKLAVLVEELKEARFEAESANRLKSRFLASMSHEIRTPMNGVLGMTNLILSTPLSEEQKQFVETIQNCGDSLLTIINDILDFSKIEAGELVLENISFDILQCMEESVDLLAVKAVEKNIELVNYVDESVPRTVYGDPGRLRQVIVNLLSNATKFTSKGDITMVASASLVSTGNSSKEGGETHDIYEIHVSVKDTGIGIAKDRMARLFKPFSQLDETMTRKFGGTGLGLIISRQLVELMGGRVWAESEGEDKGSTFHFTVLVQTKDDKSRKSTRRLSTASNSKTITPVIKKLRRFESLDSVLVEKDLDSNLDEPSVEHRDAETNHNQEKPLRENGLLNNDKISTSLTSLSLDGVSRAERCETDSITMTKDRSVEKIGDEGFPKVFSNLKNENSYQNSTLLPTTLYSENANQADNQNQRKLNSYISLSRSSSSLISTLPTSDSSSNDPVSCLSRTSSLKLMPSLSSLKAPSSHNLSSDESSLSPHGVSTTNQTFFPTHREANCKGKTVLVIDQFPTSQEMLKKYLSSLSMNVFIAENAPDALKILEKGRYDHSFAIDVIITDSRMNWIPSSKDSKAIVSSDADVIGHHTLPTLLFCPYGTAKKELYLNSNVVAVLSKPIRQTQLSRVLIEIFKKDAKTHVSARARETLIKDAGFRSDLAARHPLNILLAEDNIVNQKVACKTLGKLGYKCDVVGNGCEALSALEAQNYDLVFMDLQMPMMDGIEATKSIIQRFGHDRRPKIFAMTANVLESHRSLCLEVGMDGFIPKPINVRDIVQAIEKCHQLNSQR